MSYAEVLFGSVRRGVFTTGSLIAASATIVRLEARDLAWPTEYSYGGDRLATPWGIKETAYVELSTAFLAFGLALVLLAVASRLFAQPSTAAR